MNDEDLINNLINEILNKSDDKNNFNALLNSLQQNLFQINKDKILKDSSSLNKKIRNNYEKLKLLYPNISLEQYTQSVLRGINDNNYDTILLYIKSPVRQNIFEPLQIAILQNYFKISIHRYNKEKFNQTKSFDGISEDNKFIFQCKYIKESGGSQDNQFNDLITFNIDQDNYINYLVVSGNYGIKKMKEYLKYNILKKNTIVIILDNDITFIENKNMELKKINAPSDKKKYNKYYSTVSQLIENINLSNVLSSFGEYMTIIEPYAGDCNLLNMFKDDLINSNKFISSFELYDITTIDYSCIKDMKRNIIFDINENQDTLLNNVFNISNAPYFVITNPPYTAKNKLDPETKSKYKLLLNTDIQDLYQIFIKHLINSFRLINGGCIIIPSNFMFGKQSENLRINFLSKYDIINLNIFEKQMFDYTTQSVITLLFINKELNNLKTEPIIKLYRSNEIITIAYDSFIRILNFNFHTKFMCDSVSVSVNDIDDVNDDVNVNDNVNDNDSSRDDNNSNHNIIVKRNYNVNDSIMIISDIKVSLLDPKIEAFIDVNNKNIQDKSTDRAYMRLCFNKRFTIEQEKQICKLFNEHIEKLRNETYSLVMTSYREYSRKRLSFEEVYTIMKYVIFKGINSNINIDNGQ